MNKRKGIVLAGGSGSRLFPVTKSISKQLIPIYDKPMIFYPIAVLMLSEIKDILIITSPEHIHLYQKLLGDGSDWGINISYEEQEKPRGLAEAFLIGEKFIGNDSVALILGDNLFYGNAFKDLLIEAKNNNESASIFAYRVSDPERFGVVEFDKNYNALSIMEKPKKPKSNYAVTGLYYYDNEVIKIAKNIEPSDRGELEITDINKEYLSRKKLSVKVLGSGYAWLDTGTPDSLIEASHFIYTLEKRQGVKIMCPEEISFKNGWITKDKLLEIASLTKNNYNSYLKRIAE